MSDLGLIVDTCILLDLLNKKDKTKEVWSGLVAEWLLYMPHNCNVGSSIQTRDPVASHTPLCLFLFFLSASQPFSPFLSEVQSSHSIQLLSKTACRKILLQLQWNWALGCKLDTFISRTPFPYSLDNGETKQSSIFRWKLNVYLPRVHVGVFCLLLVNA